MMGEVPLSCPSARIYSYCLKSTCAVFFPGHKFLELYINTNFISVCLGMEFNMGILDIEAFCYR